MTTADVVPEERVHSASGLARIALTAFLGTFIAARVLVFLIMSRRIPDLYLYTGGTHVHHLNYGIFLLSAVGAVLLFRRPRGRGLSAAAVAYGMGMALTFDEFGMWLHLGGSYWQRASWDAITVVGGLLLLIAFAPSIERLRPRHWWIAGMMAVAVAVFFVMLYDSLQYGKRVLAPKLHRIETTGPQ